MARKGILQKLGFNHHEYWPWWMVLGPIWPIWGYYGIKAKCFTYFTTINPSFKDGDFQTTSKKSILDLIPDVYKPTTIFIYLGTSIDTIQNLIYENNISYPCVAKPDIGGMGRKVEIIENELALENYASTVGESFLIQQKVDYPLEFGIFYYHIPNTNEYGITSVVMKEFLFVIGNGKDNLHTLMSQNERAKTQLSRLTAIGNIVMQYVPAKDERVELEPIGNHCRGTKFIDANYLIDKQLVEVFHNISKQIDGFYYGRYDLRVQSIENLKAGNTIKIMELNGMNSAPAHIYDSNSRLRDAYICLAKHAKIVYRIAKIQLANGVKATPIMSLVNRK
jgi:hypothetical protein